MRVLLAEDSDTIRNSLTQALREAGYAVDAVADGRRALINLRTSDYDAAIVDWGLPELDGLTLLSQAREKGVRTPVLMLTARDAVDDRVRALSTGADDYIVKPFALSELKARLQAVIRRASGHARSVVTIGPLVVDAGARRVTANGRPLETLTPREQALLEYLAHRAGKPVPRAELEEHLYDDRSRVLSNTVDSAVCSLRAKLEAAGCSGLIKTRRKLGYVLTAAPDDSAGADA